MNWQRISISLVFAAAIAGPSVAQRSGGHGSGGGGHFSSGGGGHFGAGGSRSFGGFGGSHTFSGSHFGGSRSFGSSSSHSSRGFGGFHSFGGTTHTGATHTFGHSFGQSTGGVSHGSQGGSTFGRASSGVTNRFQNSGGRSGYLGGGRVYGSQFNNSVRGGTFANNRFGAFGGGFGGHDRVGHFFGDRRGFWGDGFRCGFWGYPGWGAPGFFFGFYLFDPFLAPCVISPWYYYPCLPPYIPEERVYIESEPSFDWNGGSDYGYQQGQDPASYGNHPLNDAVGEIQAIFNGQDDHAIDSLIVSSGKIAIYNDGKYMYSLNGADFRSMMMDNMKDTRTVSFDVTYVHTSGDTAIVKCRHGFTDPQGGNDTIYQMYRLHRENGHYVITDFMTSHNVIRQNYF